MHHEPDFLTPWEQGYPDSEGKHIRGVVLKLVEADPVQLASLRDAGAALADAVIIGSMESRPSKEVSFTCKDTDRAMITEVYNCEIL